MERYAMLTGFLCLTLTFTCFRCVFIEESTCAGQLSGQLQTGWLLRGECKTGCCQITAVIVPETCVPFLSSMVTVSFTLVQSLEKT
jgi:hypothetical protein